jgi:hypothetical protein
VLLEIQEGFKIKIAELPNELDTSLYMWLIASDLNIVSISILFLFFWLIIRLFFEWFILLKIDFFDEELTSIMALIFYGFS